MRPIPNRWPHRWKICQDMVSVKRLVNLCLLREVQRCSGINTNSVEINLTVIQWLTLHKIHVFRNWQLDQRLSRMTEGDFPNKMIRSLVTLHVKKRSESLQLLMLIDTGTDGFAVYLRPWYLKLISATNSSCASACQRSSQIFVIWFWKVLVDK